MACESARNLATERLQHRDQLSERLRTWLDDGAQISAARYDAALELARKSRRAFADLFRAARCDALLAPSAPGEAPEGLAATGDPLFNRLWTLLHGPGVHVPLTVGPRGLPLGVQVVGPRGTDATVLRAAAWLQGAGIV